MVWLDLNGQKSNSIDAIGHPATEAALPPCSLQGTKDSRPVNYDSGSFSARGGVKNAGNEKEKDVTLEKLDLSQIWGSFLGETSLHGCKNVRERSLFKRLVWCCMIVLMAATLGWALVSLFLKYQDHPFVSVWSFQRQSTILAPGITICFPARYNKNKLKNSRPAYQILGFESTGMPLFDTFNIDDQSMENLTESFKIWEKELDNVTVNQAQREIGFTKKEVFMYAKLFLKDKEIDITGKMIEISSDSSICWWVQWLLPDPPSENIGSGGLVHPSESKESMASENVIVTSSETDKSIEQHSSVNNTYEGSFDWASFLRESFLSNNSKPVATHTSSAQPLRQLFQFTTAATDVDATNRPIRKYHEMRKELEQSEEEEVRSTKAVSLGEELLRLSPRDYIMFSVNLHQHNWPSTNLMAGLDVFLHDPLGGYYSRKHVLLRPGTYNLIEYTATNYKFLPLPYKSFSGRMNIKDSTRTFGCVDTTSASFKSPLASVPKSLYSSDMCVLEYAINRSVQVCGCGVDSFFNSMLGVPMCSILQHTRCYSKIINEETIRQQSDQLCPRACTYTEFGHGTSATDFPTLASRHNLAWATGMEEELLEKNLLVIKIKPEGPLSVTVEHVPELTVLSILGSAGGWMGLCLGASLLTLTEFFEAVAMSVWILYRKLMGQLGIK